MVQMGLHHRTAWNAAFTTWKKAAQNLHFFPDRHVQWNAGYKQHQAFRCPSSFKNRSWNEARTRFGTRCERGPNEVRRRPSKFHELYCLSRWRNTWKLTHKHLPCMWQRMVGMMTSTTTLRNLITSHHLTSPAIRTEHECITASALQRCFQQTLLRTRSIS